MTPFPFPLRACLALLIFLIRYTYGLVCSVPTLGGSTHRNKTCPDFKADPSFVYCCTSKLPPTGGVFKEKHGVFCCSLSDFEKERQEQADEEFKSFMKDYLALIVLCSLVFLCLIVVITSIVCRRIRQCPLYRDGSVLAHSMQTTNMYRPVDTIPPKIYEAPPPYECFVPPPDQRRNDWNCVLENEVNGSRRLAPIT